MTSAATAQPSATHPKALQLALREYSHVDVELGQETVDFIVKHFRDALNIAPRGNGLYRIETNSRVGTLVAPGLELRILPKTPLPNLLYMLGYAYGLADFRRELTDQIERPDLRELLIVIFAGQLEDLLRRGLRRGYVEEDDDIPVLRGRLLVDRLVRQRPGGAIRLPCRFEEYSVDLIHNELLRYTLKQLPSIVDRNLVSRLQRLRRVFNQIRWRPFRIPEIDEIHYDRFTDHYRPLHAMCKLLLLARGLEHEAGGFPIGSFLVDMNLLFEKFVTRWLEERLPRPFSVWTQHVTHLDLGGRIAIRPDLVLLHRGEPFLVADTKYKQLGPAGPGNPDVYQALAYCRVLRVRTGVLLYPNPAKSEGSFELRDGENVIRTDGASLMGEPPDVEREMTTLVERLVGYESTLS